MTSKTYKNAFLLFGAIAMIIMSFRYLIFNNVGVLQINEMASSPLYLIVFRCHVGFGLIAIFVGALQLFKSVRKKGIKLHQLFGYSYVSAICISSIAGLGIAQFSLGGWVTQIGFSIQALLWFVLTYKGMMFGIRQDFTEHKKWIFRSYALTFTAITQRSMLLIPLLSSIDFMFIYKLSSWLPWIINLAIVEFILHKKEKPQTIAL